MKFSYNLTLKETLATLSFISAIGLAIAGMIIIPKGEIHGSVLIMCGQLLIACATFLGLKMELDIPAKRFKAGENIKKEEQ